MRQFQNKYFLIGVAVLLVTSIFINIYLVNRKPKTITVTNTVYHQEKLIEKDSLITTMQVIIDSLQASRIPQEKIIYRYYEKKHNTVNTVHHLDFGQRDSTWAGVYGTGW